MIISLLPLWITVFVYLVDIITLLYLLYEDRDPAETAFWALMIIIFPLGGAIVFFFFGRDWRAGTRRTKKELKIQNDAKAKFMPKLYEKYKAYDAKFFKDFKGNWLTRIAKANQFNDFAPVLPAETFKYLPSGESGFKSLKEDLKAAKKSIHLEFFIWEKDILTRELTDILVEKHRAGVEVRLKYDFLGSVAYGKSEIKEMRKAGIKAIADVTDINRFNYRNHRKIAVIDGLVGYTGGINIGQEYIDGGEAYPAWRDSFVRVTGPIVIELQKVFAMRWLVTGKENLFNKKYFPDQAFSAKAIPAQLNYSSSDYYWSTARDSYLMAILNATERVYIQSPYFIPDQALVAALETAALSGVDVRLLMTGWPDKKYPWNAAQTFFPRLLKAGMKIYYYNKGFMHAKSVMVDDEFTSIGTTNFDVRSFTLQKENTMFFFDKGIAKQHLKVYQDDLKECREFTLKDYENLTWFQKLVNSLSKLLSNLY